MPSLKRMVVALVAGTAAAVWLAPETRAQLARRGGEFRVNSSTAIGPTGAQVAALPGRGFVVVWDSAGADGDGWGVLGRRFGAEAQPLGGDFLVNSVTAGNQTGPRVAAARDGSFFVVWNTVDGAGQGFDAQGRPAGQETVIAEPEMRGSATSVAATEDGEFVVVFSVFRDFSIRARRFSGDGQPVAPSFLVNSYYYETRGVIASGAGDSSMIVWLDQGSLIEGRLFEGDQPSGPKFPVGEGAIDGPEICSHGTEGFVVTWTSYDGDSSDTIARYRRYDFAGNPVTDVLQAPRPPRGRSANRPVVACGPQDDLALGWLEVHSTCLTAHTGVYSICGRSFTGDADSMFRVSAPESRLALAPSLGPIDARDFVLTWLECDEEGVCDILGQRFTRSPPADCPGDCDRDGAVTIDELVAAVTVALNDLPSLVKQCLPADVNLDYEVSINELVAAVKRALQGC